MKTPRSEPALDMPETARGVAEYLLEETGHGLMTGDFDRFFACFAVPNELDTMDGRRRLENREDFLQTFEAVRAHLMASGVTDMVRHVVEAAFQDADTIHSTHETRLVGRDVLVQKPFPVFSIYRRVPEGWHITYSQYAITDEEAHNRALMGTKAPDK